MPGGRLGGPEANKPLPTLQELRAKNAAIYTAGTTGPVEGRAAAIKAAGGGVGRLSPNLKNFMFTRAGDPNVSDAEYARTYNDEIRRSGGGFGDFLSKYFVPALAALVTWGVGGAVAGAAGEGATATTAEGVAPLASQQSLDAFLTTVPEATAGTTLPVGGAATDITSAGAPAAGAAAGNAFVPTRAAPISATPASPGAPAGSQPAPTGTRPTGGAIDGPTLSARDIVSIGMTLSALGRGNQALPDANISPTAPALESTLPSTDPNSPDEKARQRQRRVAAASIGRGDTILTSPLGILGSSRRQEARSLIGA